MGGGGNQLRYMLYRPTVSLLIGSINKRRLGGGGGGGGNVGPEGERLLIY